MKNDPESFLTEAEKLIRELAPKKGWTVWKGRYAGFLYPPEKEYDCVIAGIGDSSLAPQKELFALAVGLSHESRMAIIETEDSSCHSPFGGGWEPLKELREVAEKLPSLV